MALKIFQAFLFSVLLIKVARLCNYKQALAELGLPTDYDIRSDGGFVRAMAIWKELTVEARKQNDDAHAATLSLCKVLIQKKYQYHKSRICPKCGRAKARHSAHCQMCNVQLAYYSDKLDEPKIMLHQIESALIPVPNIQRKQGELVRALKILGEGNIGDSFVTNRSASSCVFMAKTLGGNIICRIANPTEKDPKKRLYRIWRTDGLSQDEVNAILAKRLKGETVEKPPAWVPPSAEEMAKINDRKHPAKKKPSGAST